MAAAEPLLALLGELLSTALATDHVQDTTSNALLREQLSATTDALTGLPNRLAWQRSIEHAQARYQRRADPTVVAMIDLDRLKTINDTQGHAAGDAYITAAATALQDTIRDTDLAARLGGDEFGLLPALLHHRRRRRRHRPHQHRPRHRRRRRLHRLGLRHHSTRLHRRTRRSRQQHVRRQTTTPQASRHQRINQNPGIRCVDSRTR